MLEPQVKQQIATYFYSCISIVHVRASSHKNYTLLLGLCAIA